MRLNIISCEVFCREFRYSAAQSEHLIDIAFQPFGLHDTPAQLKINAQIQIDATPEGRYDYILIGYGLCSRGTAGLTTSHTPLVIPRAHDCITLFLGSKECYAKRFEESPGTYYYSSGWIERKDGSTEQGNIQMINEEAKKKRIESYAEKYGEDNARYLIEMEYQWFANYGSAAFIDLGIGDAATYRSFTRQVAESRDWNYEEIQGNIGLIQKFLDGNWTDQEFLIVPPGYQVVQTFDDQIIEVESVEASPS